MLGEADVKARLAFLEKAGGDQGGQEIEGRGGRKDHKIRLRRAVLQRRRHQAGKQALAFHIGREIRTCPVIEAFRPRAVLQGKFDGVLNPVQGFKVPGQCLGRCKIGVGIRIGFSSAIPLQRIRRRPCGGFRFHAIRPPFEALAQPLGG
ncbi:MAG: hypothetical protein ACPHIA_02680 [Alphaproteobacteria bacterium]